MILDIDETDSLNLSDIAHETLYGDDWASTAQDKLEDWRDEALKLSEKHDLARAFYTIQRDGLNIPIIALSGITTVLLGVQAVVSSAEEIDPMSLSTLLISGVTTFLSGVNAFYSPAERVQRHIQVCNAYGSLARHIDYILHLPVQKRPDVEVSYVQATMSFDRIASEAPPLPRKIRKTRNE
jgi:hypothetical protein